MTELENLEARLLESGQRYAIIEAKLRASEQQVQVLTASTVTLDRQLAIQGNEVERLRRQANALTEKSKSREVVSAKSDKFVAEISVLKSRCTAYLSATKRAKKSLSSLEDMQPAWVLAYATPITDDPIRSLRLTGGWLDRTIRFFVP